MPWTEQLKYRFLISMDGNGATCSRLANGLGSNSALVKYESSHLLYYFSGMRPWLHFIPVCDHQSVLNVIAIERKYPGFFQPIAEAGKKFSSAFLNVAAAKKYTAQLLRLYGGMFRAGSPSINGSSVCPFDVLVHTQNLADIHGLVDAWVGAPESGLTVEGFAIWAAGQANSADIRYQALQSDGMLSTPVNGGYFCGTRGQSLPLRGLRVWLEEPTSLLWRCLYWGRFTDGSEAGPLEMGEVCQSTHGGYLEAIRVSWIAKEEVPQ